MLVFMSQFDRFVRLKWDDAFCLISRYDDQCFIWSLKPTAHYQRVAVLWGKVQTTSQLFTEQNVFWYTQRRSSSVQLIWSDTRGPLCEDLGWSYGGQSINDVIFIYHCCSQPISDTREKYFVFQEMLCKAVEALSACAATWCAFTDYRQPYRHRLRPTSHVAVFATTCIQTFFNCVVCMSSKRSPAKTHAYESTA